MKNSVVSIFVFSFIEYDDYDSVQFAIENNGRLRLVSLSLYVDLQYVVS